MLVGHFYGGLIARLYGSTHPEDVSGLVLVDALTDSRTRRLPNGIDRQPALG